MSLVVPKYRVLLDDTESIKDPLAHGLIKLVEPQNAVTWDLLPFRPAVSQLVFERASRSVSAREVVLDNSLTTVETDVHLTSGTKARVTDGHILYHPATKQRIVIDEMTQSTGVGTIEVVLQAPGGSRTEIASGETLYVLSQAENFEEINAESRYEDTAIVTNYVQDMTEMLEWSVADLREARKWDVDEQLKLKERMRDLMKDLNMSILYNVPQAHTSSLRAITSGFDYAVENASSIVDAAASGTADIADIRGIGKTLQRNGVGPSDGLIAVMSVDAYHAYNDEGLAEIQLNGQPGTEFILGNILKGVNLPGIGFVPFYADPFITDDRVRFISTAHAGKAYYQGQNGPLETPKVIDEPNISTSKVKKSTLQQKWTTIIDNPGTVHFILDNTGL
jgi:hypothetical protein